MDKLTTVGWIAEAAGAELLGDGSLGITGIATDARSVQPGELFVGIRGARFDGTDFAADAVKAGAAAVFVSRRIEGLEVPQIVAENVLEGFKKSAAAWRRRFAIPVISVSGSNGKTTTTQMIASILHAAYGNNFLATRGNFNNDVGVPITLWRLRKKDRAAVIESGMSHIGEMKDLASMIAPTVAVITNAQREHQEFLSGVEATARENAESIVALPNTGVAVFPSDDACEGIWRKAAGNRTVRTFATRAGCASEVSAEVLALAGTVEVRLHAAEGDAMVRIGIGGVHNGHNAAGAAAACLAAGVPLQKVVQGLSSFEPVARRGVRHTLPNGVLLIDDTYNANPDSMRAGIDVLASGSGPRVLIAGDMGEVGEKGPEFHREIGAYACEKGIEKVLCCGELMESAAQACGGTAEHFENLDGLIPAAVAAVRAMKGGTVLVKASNFMHFDRVVSALLPTDGN